MITRSTSKLPELETLRGLMALWVFVGHVVLLSGIRDENRILRQISNAGLAVDVFIILSGFVITLLLLRESLSYSSYLARRFFRLYPVYVISLVFSVVLRHYLGQPEGVRQGLPWVDPDEIAISAAAHRSMIQYFWQHVVAHATMLHGALPRSVLPYAPQTFNGPAWSISLEWQFYLVAPMLLAMLRNLRRWLPVLLLIVLVAILSKRLTIGDDAQFRAASFLPVRIHYFLIGMVCAVYFVHFRAVAAEYHRWIVLAVAALAGVSEVYFFYPVLIWLGFFYLILSDERGAIEAVRRLILLRPARWLGRISYSLYLLHMPILYAVAGLIATASPPGSRWRFAATLLAVALPLTLALSALCYRYVEKPFIDFAKKRFSGPPIPVAPVPGSV